MLKCRWQEPSSDLQYLFNSIPLVDLTDFLLIYPIFSVLSSSYWSMLWKTEKH